MSKPVEQWPLHGLVSKWESYRRHPGTSKMACEMARRLRKLDDVLESMEPAHGMAGLHPEDEGACSTCLLKTAVRRILDGK